MPTHSIENRLPLYSPGEWRLPDSGQAARWTLYLLLSLALHLALLATFPFASMTRDMKSVFPLDVRLVGPADLSTRDAALEPEPARQRRDAARNETGGAGPAARPSETNTIRNAEPGAPAAGAIDNRRLPATGVLLDMARRFSREPDAHAQKEPGGKYGTGLTASERFARVLKHPEPGERHLENGTIKITTPGGTVYCITEPPHFMQSGVVPPMAVPTTCP